MFARLFSSMLFAALLLCPSFAGAVDTAEVKPEQQATPEQIENWVADLESAQFAAREEATRQLQAAGIAALPAVVDVAQNGSAESSRRAFDVLKNHVQQGEEAVKAAAKKQLETLAKSEDARVARRAKRVLDPPQNQLGQIVPGRGIRVMPLQGKIQIQGGAIQIAAGQAGRVVQVRQNNNGRNIKVTEGDKKVEIDDDGKGGDIKITVTEKVDGKEQTKKYEAKNLEELKKNHPEGAKMYEKYSQNGAGIQIRAVQIQPGQLPQRFNPRNVLPARKPNEAQQKAAEEIELAQKQLEEAIDELKQADTTDQKALDAIRAKMQAAAEKLKAAGEKLGK